MKWILMLLLTVSTVQTQWTGNRVIDGQGTFPNVNSQTIALPDVPLWAVGVVINAEVGWVVSLANEDVYWIVPDAPILFIDHVAAGTPPLVTINADGLPELIQLAEDVAPYAPPVRVSDGWAYVAANGDVVRLDADLAEVNRLPLGVQPDARLVVSDDGRVAVYVMATNQRYVHGIMGDDLEGVALAVLSIGEAGLAIEQMIQLSGETVFEGLSPMWADVDQDGEADLIATQSNASEGAWLMVYSALDGSVIATGQAIGQGYRWRHQLVWGAFGWQGEMALVDVLTPHIGGVVEFFQLDNGALLRVGDLSGWTSHVINSRNLDMAVAGDFNGDGVLEIVLPDQARHRLGGVQQTADGVMAVWELPFTAGALTTNLAAVTLPDGRLALGAGTDGNVFQMWIP